jgi:hypothetical protein
MVSVKNMLGVSAQFICRKRLLEHGCRNFVVGESLPEQECQDIVVGKGCWNRDVGIWLLGKLAGTEVAEYGCRERLLEQGWRNMVVE